MRENILIVDDEESVLRLFAGAFESRGYSVFCARSGEEALGLLGRENIQVMFLDLKLPGMDGLELARKVRRDHPIALIFAVTGYASLFELAGCRDAGFDDYFTKPVDLGLLLRAAKDAFERLERWRRREPVPPLKQHRAHPLLTDEEVALLLAKKDDGEGLGDALKKLDLWERPRAPENS